VKGHAGLLELHGPDVVDPDDEELGVVTMDMDSTHSYTQTHGTVSGKKDCY
jgi:hypothetical protein